MGYRAALVPGAFLFGHFSRVAIEAWGLDWAARGGVGARFRRPVYNGDTVVLEASALVRFETRVRSELVMRDQDGEPVATGWIDLPDVPDPLPDPALWPLQPHADPRPVVEPGSLTPGLRGSTADAVLTAQDWAESLAAFDEHHPIYRREGILHAGCLMRRAMSDVYGGFQFPGPVVLVGCEARHYAVVRPGARLATSSVVAEAYERNGRYYMESDEVLFAEGLPAASYRRVQIYATQPRA
jgi:acyl dehydratase